MSDYTWFALKAMTIIAVIGAAVWVTKTGWPLWAYRIFSKDYCLPVQMRVKAAFATTGG